MSYLLEHAEMELDIIGMTEDNPDETKKWFWKVDWCKRHGVSPYDSFNWDRAEEEYMRTIS